MPESRVTIKRRSGVFRLVGGTWHNWFLRTDHASVLRMPNIDPGRALGAFAKVPIVSSIDSQVYLLKPYLTDRGTWYWQYVLEGRENCPRTWSERFPDLADSWCCALLCQELQRVGFLSRLRARLAKQASGGGG